MIYTFYSYKGGAGRSMALANVAKYLYEKGVRVLIIDFDLDAPGIERFFSDSKFLSVKDIDNKLGVIDLINSYRNFIALYDIDIDKEGSGNNINFGTYKNQRYLNSINTFFDNNYILEYLTQNIYPQNIRGGELHLMPSGCRTNLSNYFQNVKEQNWNYFYDCQYGESFFNKFIEEVKKIADVILVDSRTGITEIGGVCINHLADAVVTFVVPTSQSINGAYKIAKKLNGNNNIKKKYIIFVPSRIDKSEKEFSDKFEIEFENYFGINQEIFNKAILDEGINLLEFKERAYSDLKIPYVPYYSFKETLAIGTEETSGKELRDAYINIAYTLSQLAPKKNRLVEVFSGESKTNYHVKKHDWGTAPESDRFFGRTTELAILEQWILEERCQIVEILGMGGVGKTNLSVRLSKGGIGKTDLSLKLARGVRDHFDYVIWRTLQSRPSLKVFLPELIRFFIPKINLPNELGGQIKVLLDFLKEHRCLLILDNAESILNPDNYYKTNYEGYSALFKEIGETKHQSCLILTSREKHPEVAEIEQRTSLVKSLHLDGLDFKDGKKLIESVVDSCNGNTISGNESEWKKIVDFYNGNPLALKLLAQYIINVCSGNIKEFLESGLLLFETINELLDWHFSRLSDPEKDVMFWLAINQKPVSYRELQEDILDPIANKRIIEILNYLQLQISIQKRSSQKIIVESKSPKEENRKIDPQEITVYSLHPVIMEYTIKTLINRIYKELAIDKRLNIKFLNKYALIKATTSESARNNQSKLILEPIINRFKGHYGNNEELIKRLKYIVIQLRIQKENTLYNGYAAGNLINFLYYLTQDLKNQDFSRLYIRQAYLQGLQLEGTDFSYSHFRQSIFTNKLSHVLSVALSPYGNAVATGDSSGEICIWNVGDGSLIQNFNDHHNWVWSVKFSPDKGKRFASASDDRTARTWDIIKGEPLKILTESEESSRKESHTDWVRCVAFDLSGKLLASGSDDSSIKIWNARTGKHLKTLNCHKKRVWSVAFNPNGKTLVSGSDDQTVIVWNFDGKKLETNEKSHDWKSVDKVVLKEAHKGRVQAVAFSDKGDVFASGGADATVKIWDASTYQCVKTIYFGEYRIWSLAFLPNNSKKIAVASDEPILRIYDIDTGDPFRTFIGHKSRIRSVSFASETEKLTLASGSEDKTAKIWDVEEGKCLQTFQGRTDRVWSVAFSADGKYLVNGSEDQQIRLWNLNNSGNQYQSFKEIQERTYWVWSVVFHPLNSQLIATGSDENIVKIWNVETKKLIRRLEGHTNWVLSVAFSTDGKYLVSGSEDTTIKIWDFKTEECFVTLKGKEGHKDRVRSVCFHPNDSSILASASDDRKIILWKWEKDTNKFNLLWSSEEDHQSRVRSVTFSHNGQYLCSSSDDTKIIVWKLELDSHEQPVSKYHVLDKHTDKVVSLAFHPQDKYLASGSDDRTVRVWDIKTGTCLKVIRGHTKWVRSVAFRKDGVLASSSQDETIRLWDTNSDNFWELEDKEWCEPLKAKGDYHNMNITGIKGLTPTQINTLKALGAVSKEKDSNVFSGLGDGI